MLMLYAPITGLGDTAAFLPRCPPDAMRLADGRSWRGVSANHKQVGKRARPILKAAFISLPHDRKVSGRAGDAVVPLHRPNVTTP